MFEISLLNIPTYVHGLEFVISTAESLGLRSDGVEHLTHLIHHLLFGMVQSGRKRRELSE
jgi:hypothetical protein